MTTQTPAGVRDYLARMRTALADLPQSEVDEILEDVRPHLLEIGEELGENAGLAAMAERLGSPESYAAELRAAGDYPSPDQKTSKAGSPLVAARLALWSMVGVVVILLPYGVVSGSTLDADSMLILVPIAAVLAAGGWFLHRHGENSVGSLPEVRSVSRSLSRSNSPVLNYLRSLRPAWWLACAVILIALGLLMVVEDGREGLVALFFLGVIAVGVVWLGPKSVRQKKWLWVSLPVSALVLGAAAGVFAGVADRVIHSRYSNGYPYQTANVTDNGNPALQYGSQQVDNIYAFDAQGKPLTGVYLFDENGRPLSLPRYSCEPGIGTRQRTGSDNQYPRPQIQQGGYDDNGTFNGYNAYRPGCRELTETPFSAAIPKGVPVPAPAAPPGPATTGPNTPPSAPAAEPGAPSTAPTPTG